MISGANRSNPLRRARPLLDRRALVERHKVVISGAYRESPLQVGNGEFAFGVDITGLQTFAPFATMAHWGWHSLPLPPGDPPEAFRGQVLEAHGRARRYQLPNSGQPELSQWLAANPHRLNLGRIGLVLIRADGRAAALDDLQSPWQELDLWRGLITSSFSFAGFPVRVETCCHPTRDALAIRIASPLAGTGRLAVALEFAYGSTEMFSASGADWTKPEAHQTRLTRDTAQRARIARQLDADAYFVALCWSNGAELRQEQKHRFILLPAKTGHCLELVCAFTPQPDESPLPAFAKVKAASSAHWGKFWNSGGAVDFSASKDTRWRELERRVVLSQYLLAVNAAGSLPPQESGLVNNGWYGRFHFEMYWWHAAHYALWDRWPLLERSLGVYQRLLDAARRRAQAEGWRGARWPKCTGPDGREWPHPVHAWLIWQQPHPIFFAELDYRAHPLRATLEKWREVVFATADFMAACVCRNKATGFFGLGPPLYAVSENTDPQATRNPAFELAYWRFGLRLAQAWAERLGLARDSAWDRVLNNLAPLPVENGCYLLHEGVRDMWTKWNWEHPALTGVFGLLPGDGARRDIMARTFQKVLAAWDFNRVWGWDFPLLAMCAARLGRAAQAVDLLLYPAEKFQFRENGLATGGPFPYFPSNGGLLYAVAMMAAGWDGAPKRRAPGFPDNGNWVVRWEGLKPAP